MANIQIPIRTKAPPQDLDVYAIRMQARGIGYTQGSFAEAIGVSVKTVQNWEQRRRKPTGPARALLVVIAHDPVAFANAIRVSTLGHGTS
jgi:putative transcriptional regulator